jgi:hypothetical protein
MQQAGAQQFLHHNRHAADRMQAAHRERAMRLQVGEQRDALADRLDALDRDRHLRLARDREQMQIHVGRAAHRVDVVIAFSNARSVMMSRGRMPACISRYRPRPKPGLRADVGVMSLPAS